jgi:hypothetical protein
MTESNAEVEISQNSAWINASYDDMVYEFKKLTGENKNIVQFRFAKTKDTNFNFTDRYGFPYEEEEDERKVPRVVLNAIKSHGYKPR